MMQAQQIHVVVDSDCRLCVGITSHPSQTTLLQLESLSLMVRRQITLNPGRQWVTQRVLRQFQLTRT